MAGPNPWQAKAARDTGESASTHGSDRQATPGPAEPGNGGLFGVGSADGVADASTRDESGATNVAQDPTERKTAPVAGRESAGDSRRRRADAVRARAAAARGVGAPLRGHWGYLVAAVGAFITLVLMTRPWLVAVGADGSVQSTAFGRLDVSTKYLMVWSNSAPKTPQVSGLWAFATAAAIVLTICLVVLYFRMPSEYFARLVVFSSVGVAVLVLFTMVYLDSKGAALKALTDRRYDLGGQVGQLLSWVKGNGKFIVPGASEAQYVATSRFTASAVAAATIAVVSALAAVTQWLVGRGVEPGGLMAKVSALREKWDAAGRAATLKSASPAARTGSEAAEPATAQAVSTDKPAIVEPAGAQTDPDGPSTGERITGVDR